MRPCSGAEWLVSLRFALPKNAMNVIFCWLNPHFFNHFLYCKIWVINGLSRMIIHEELIVWCWAPYFLKGQDLSPHQVRAQQVRNEEELVQLSESQRIPECERIGKGKTGNQKPCLNMTYIYIYDIILEKSSNITETYLNFFSGKRWGWILEMLFVGKLCWWPAAYTLDLAVHSVHSALQPWPEALVAPVGLWVENTDQWFVVSMFSTIFL